MEGGASRPCSCTCLGQPADWQPLGGQPQRSVQLRRARAGRQATFVRPHTLQHLTQGQQRLGTAVHSLGQQERPVLLRRLLSNQLQRRICITQCSLWHACSKGKVSKKGLVRTAQPRWGRRKRKRCSGGVYLASARSGFDYRGLAGVSPLPVPLCTSRKPPGTGQQQRLRAAWGIARVNIVGLHPNLLSAISDGLCRCCNSMQKPDSENHGGRLRTRISSRLLCSASLHSGLKKQHTTLNGSTKCCGNARLHGMACIAGD